MTKIHLLGRALGGWEGIASAMTASAPSARAARPAAWPPPSSGSPSPVAAGFPSAPRRPLPLAPEPDAPPSPAASSSVAASPSVAAARAARAAPCAATSSSAEYIDDDCNHWPEARQERGQNRGQLTPRPRVAGEIALHGLRGGHLPLELIKIFVRVLELCN
jgi:hypothetical protein